MTSPDLDSYENYYQEPLCFASCQGINRVTTQHVLFNNTALTDLEYYGILASNGIEVSPRFPGDYLRAVKKATGSLVCADSGHKPPIQWTILNQPCSTCLGIQQKLQEFKQ